MFCRYTHKTRGFNKADLIQTKNPALFRAGFVLQ